MDRSISLTNTVSRREWCRASLWASVVLVLSSLPYLVGWSRSTPEFQFGGLIYDIPDAHSYLAKMQQGAQGEWLLRLPYTPEPHSGGPFYFFYLMLGKLTGALGLQMFWGYHLARLGCGLLLLLTAYHVIAYLTPWHAVRHIAYLMVCVGSGFGWLAMAAGMPQVLGHMPLDLWSPDGFAFVTIYGFPHMCFSQAMLLQSLLWGFRGILNPRWRYWGYASITALLASLVHPYSVAFICGILGAYATLRGLRVRRFPWRSWICVMVIALPSIPYVLWVLWTFATNPAFAAWRQRGLNYSPSLIWVVTGYGFIMLWAVLGVAYAWRSEAGRFAALWAILNLAALYIPFSLQRRLISGFLIPLATLAAMGLAHVFLPWLWRVWPRRFYPRGRYTRRGVTHLLVFAAILLTTPTNLLILGGGVLAALLPEPALFHSADQLQAVDWFADHAERGDVVLASLPEGNYLPTRAGLRVVLGLDPETIDFDTKYEQVNAFFSTRTPDAERRALLREYGVDYVLYGPNEKAIGGFDPQSAPYLDRVATFGTYVVYAVVNP